MDSSSNSRLHFFSLLSNGYFLMEIRSLNWIWIVTQQINPLLLLIYAQKLLKYWKTNNSGRPFSQTISKSDTLLQTKNLNSIAILLNNKLSKAGGCFILEVSWNSFRFLSRQLLTTLDSIQESFTRDIRCGGTFVHTLLVHVHISFVYFSL